MKRWLIACIAAFGLTSLSASAAQAPSTEALAARVRSLADAYIREVSQRFPEQVVFNGVPLERQDGLSDFSPAALREWHKLEDGWARQLDRIDSAQLFGTPDWVTLGFLREAVQSSRAMRVCHYELWPVNQLTGWPALMEQLASVQPVGSQTARAQALARWGKLPRYLTTEIGNLRAGLRQGYSTPRANVRLVIEQLDQFLASPVEQWPLYSPATRDGTASFKQAWSELLSTSIKPATQRYRDFLQNEYLAKAREPIAIKANTGGEQCYQASFRGYTTLDRPAAETFELGTREVERNLATALEVGRKYLQAEDLTTLRERLSKDPANHFASREELLQFSQAAVARAREHMPQWFARVPKSDIVVEPYPPVTERSASDSYWPAAQDGSYPAKFQITLYPFADVTRSNAEITALHEAYPGHHLQLGLAAERPDAHPITRLVGNSGFTEGWARYAEALAEEMGLYTSQHALANRRLWPARGMVIDPGIHLFGWTREQAVEYVAVSGRFENDVARALIDRVAVWPGQLTAYDTGALEFFALRKLAQERLGERFDIREFHTALLENGTVTLPMLREQVLHWLQTKAQ